VVLKENEQLTTSDRSMPLHEGESAVVPAIGITERVGSSDPDKEASDSRGDEFWRLFGLLGPWLVLPAGERSPGRWRLAEEPPTGVCRDELLRTHKRGRTERASLGSRARR
jgi:hypothetical protein